MPIQPSLKLRRLSQEEFGQLAFEVMADVFAIHQEFGRFFNEKIYKRELARRRTDVKLEVPVEVWFESFRKHYLLDVVVGDGGLFEFKANDATSPRDRAQTTNYLLLCDISHAKLVNLRPESIEHEFVNTTLTREGRLAFEIATELWDRSLPGAKRVEEISVPLLRDWGIGLELPLYEEALTHFLGGESSVLQNVEVFSNDISLGTQRLRLASSRVAFKLTALTENIDAFESHARRLLAHTALDAILWINLTRERVQFVTLK